MASIENRTAKDLIDEAVSGSSVLDLLEGGPGTPVDPRELQERLDAVQEQLQALLTDPKTDVGFRGLIEDAHDSLNILSAVMSEAAKELSSDNELDEARGEKIFVGSRVKYSRGWLKSVGQVAGDLPRARGEVTQIKKGFGKNGMATINWNMRDIPPRTLVDNLTLVSDSEIADS